ncbi:uncharacterized protein LOC121929480 [Sceloporus undulatus]|uniref:uncharacterized protein LOC121929480 n=1 Tax=Sceloporus undulatus TaxID=8520 RepID=UPI001C4B1C36|nr:uncharacterized protein LOC121929480 [Sceloporus undulatus]
MEGLAWSSLPLLLLLLFALVGGAPLKGPRSLEAVSSVNKLSYLESPTVNLKTAGAHKKKKTLFRNMDNISDGNYDIVQKGETFNVQAHSADTSSKTHTATDNGNDSKELLDLQVALNDITDQEINIDSIVVEGSDFQVRRQFHQTVTETPAKSKSGASYNSETKETSTDEGIQDEQRAEAADPMEYIILSVISVTGWIIVIMLLLEKLVSLRVKKKQDQCFSNPSTSKEDGTAKIKPAEAEAEMTEPDRRANSPIYP